MRRIALIVAAFLALPGSASAAGPASVELLECDRTGRAAEFDARMAAVPGTAQMRMRFTLHARTPAGRGWRRVAAEGWGEWTSANPGVTRYSYTRRVEDLIAPALYRVVVRFRWLDAAGRTVARARHRSRRCRQPDPRPNLAMVDLSIEPAADPAQRRYVVRVRNTARTAVAGFELRLSGDGDGPVAVVDALGIAARRERRIELVLPACRPGAEVTAEADPAGVLDERSEADNALTVTC